MSELPKGWELTNLDSVCQIVRGITFPSTDKRFASGPDLVACLRTTNVQANVEWDNLWFVPTKHVKHPHQYVLKNDILISTANSYELVGKVARVTGVKTESTLGAFISLLRANSGLEPAYLYYQMSAEATQRSIRELSSTTTNISNVSVSKLKELPFPLPPSAEQTRIVAKLEEMLSSLDAGVAELKAAQKKLVQYRQSLLKAAVEGTLTKAWRDSAPASETGSALLARILKERCTRWEAKQLAKFAAAGKAPPKDWEKKYPEPAKPDTTGLAELPKGWVWATVEQLGEIQSGIQKQPSRAPVANKYPFLRVANVARGQLKLGNVHEIELFEGELERLALEAGDILIVEGNGSLSEIGRCAIWDDSIANTVHQNHLIRVRPILVLSQFLETWLNSLGGIEKLTKLAATTSGLYTLSVGKIAKIPVPLAPLGEQESAIQYLIEALEQQTQQAKAVEHSLKQSAAQRKNILQAAFAGRLVAQDAADEPASVLLARIAKERENAAQLKRKPKRAA